MRLTPEEWSDLTFEQPGNEWSEPVIKYARPGMRTLEIGAGGAPTSRLLLEMRVEAEIADFSHAACDAYPGTSYCFDVLGDWPVGRYDLIHSAGLLEHLHPDEVLYVLNQCAQRSQLVIHLVPNARCEGYMAWKRALEQNGAWPYGDEFPRNTLLDLYSQAGLRMLEEYSVGNEFTSPNGQRYLLAAVGQTVGRSLSFVQVFRDNGDDIPITAIATLREADRLSRLGYAVQVIFVEDGSTDGSGDHLFTLATERRDICVLLRPRNGRAAALNAATGVATGEYIVLLDGGVAVVPGTEQLVRCIRDAASSIGIGMAAEQAVAEMPLRRLPEVLDVVELSEAGNHIIPMHYCVLPSWLFQQMQFRFEEACGANAVGWLWEGADMYQQFSRQDAGTFLVVRNAPYHARMPAGQPWVDSGLHTMNSHHRSRFHRLKWGSGAEEAPRLAAVGPNA